jgi:16S rRNA U516 pseudouridylate synthase RsuA-like enzyme
MTTRDWKNQRDDNPDGTESVTIRLPKGLRRAVRDIADANNTTVTAIHRFAIEKFIEDNGQNPGKGSLFD